MLPSPRSARLRPVASLLSLVALCAVAGCGDGGDPVGPVATLPVSAAQLDALAERLAPIAGQPVFEGFTLMHFGRGLPFDGEVFFPFGDRASVAESASVQPARASRQLVPLMPSIPDTLRGRTLVRDSIRLGWTIDRLADGTPRPGAPADGLRFVLSRYFTPGPSSSTRVGAMDLTQQGSGSSARFATDVRDLAGTHVLRYASSLVGTSGAGWVAHGATRVDQTTTVAGRGVRTRWTSSSVPFEAERAESFDRTALSIVHTLPIDGTQLRLESAMHPTSTESMQTTYTVYAGGAPFARRVDAMMSEGEWRHVAGNRPLTGGEQAQVRAFLRVLAAIPDAEAAWLEGMGDLMIIQNPTPPF